MSPALHVLILVQCIVTVALLGREEVVTLAMLNSDTIMIESSEFFLLFAV